MPYSPLSVGPTGNKTCSPLAVFVAQQKNYSRKAVLQNGKLFNYNYINYGGDKMQPSVIFPMFAEWLPSSTNPYKTQLTLFFSFRTALLLT